MVDADHFGPTLRLCPWFHPHSPFQVVYLPDSCQRLRGWEQYQTIEPICKTGQSTCGTAYMSVSSTLTGVEMMRRTREISTQPC